MVNDDILQLLASEAGPTLKSIAEELLRRRHEADYPVPAEVEDLPCVMRGDIAMRSTWEQVAQDRQDIVDKQRKELEELLAERKRIAGDLEACTKAAEELRARAEKAENEREEWRTKCGEATKAWHDVNTELRARAEIAETRAAEWQKTAKEWEEATTYAREGRNAAERALINIRDAVVGIVGRS
jgi:chromosome segregation ATPase